MALSVKIENLSYSYEPGKPVLKSVSIEVAPGECVGIIGPSGSGKSTLLMHLNGVLRGDGTVRIGDLLVNEKSIAEVRRVTGVVFQDPDDQLFNPTVEEDVAFGPLNFGLTPEVVRARVGEALKAMNLEGFETMTSHHLSFGERKRVALATVLAMRPEVIAFDEPFSNLDPAMVQQLTGLIRGMEATLVVVSQSILPLLVCCDRIAILKDGEVVAVAPPREIARNSDLLRSCGLDISFYRDICIDYL